MQTVKKVMCIYSDTASNADKYVRWNRIRKSCQDYFAIDGWKVKHYSDNIKHWKNPTFIAHILTVSGSFDTIVFDIECNPETMEYIRSLAPNIPCFTWHVGEYDFIGIIAKI